MREAGKLELAEKTYKLVLLDLGGSALPRKQSIRAQNQVKRESMSVQLGDNHPHGMS